MCVVFEALICVKLDNYRHRAGWSLFSPVREDNYSPLNACIHAITGKDHTHTHTLIIHAHTHFDYNCNGERFFFQSYPKNTIFQSQLQSARSRATRSLVIAPVRVCVSVYAHAIITLITIETYKLRTRTHVIIHVCVLFGRASRPNWGLTYIYACSNCHASACAQQTCEKCATRLRV